MAKSGSFSYYIPVMGNSIVVAWTMTGQSVANNRATVAWSAKLVSNSYGAIHSTAKKEWQLSVDGVVIDEGTNTVSIAGASSITLASGQFSVNYDAAGEKSFTLTYYQDFSILWGFEEINAVSLSGTVELDPLYRASQPSLVTWPETTNNVGEFGQEFSIHMNRMSSELTHTVRYEYGKRSGTIATGVTNGTTWTVPLTFMNDIPNATSASGRIYVDTYSDSEKIGTKYTGFTVTVPASVKPAVSLKLTDVSGVGDVYGVPVQGLSKIKIEVNTTPAYSSPIQSYDVRANGAAYTEQTSTTDVLKAAGSSPITATVKDARGRTGSASYTMNVLAYVPPSVTKLTVHRCDEDGTENEQGEYIRAVFSAAITPLNNKNTAAYTLRYKKSAASDFSSADFNNLANVYTVTDQAYIFAADSSSSYDVEVVATDRHGTATRATSASTAFTLMNWGPDGTSMAIGKVAEKPNTLQIALDVEFLGKVRGSILDAVYPVGSIYIAYNHTNPATLFGGTWARIENAFLWGVDSSGTIGQTGGSKTHTLTVNELPKHSHGGTYTNAGTSRTHAWLASNGSAMGYDTVEAGGGQPHNNMPPYIQVSIWRRTA
jgi:microcystin-dependent protein